MSKENGDPAYDDPIGRAEFELKLAINNLRDLRPDHPWIILLDAATAYALQPAPPPEASHPDEQQSR